MAPEKERRRKQYRKLMRSGRDGKAANPKWLASEPKVESPCSHPTSMAGRITLSMGMEAREGTSQIDILLLYIPNSLTFWEKKKKKEEFF